jgi:hypothetical protein
MRNYNTKKKTVIIILSLVAVCLAGGLFYYIGTMDGQSPAPEESMPSVETQVIVPEIKIEKPSDDEPKSTEEVAPPISSETQSSAQSKPSDGKPKSPDQATPPSEPPAENSGSQNEQNQPQGGEKRSDGAVYVPGFGWVEYEGENSQGTAPNAGTGEPVGDM